MIIRDIKGTDTHAIYKLYNLEGWKNFTKKLVEELYSNSHWVIVEDEGEVVGFGRYITDGVLTVYLCEILIEENHRRKGIGSAIIEEIFNRHKDLRIDVLSDADEFYDSLEFRHLGKAYRRYKRG